jgi:hypothetical protein
MAADYALKSIKIEVVWDMAVNGSHVDNIERTDTKMQEITKRRFVVDNRLDGENVWSVQGGVEVEGGQ